MHIKDEIKQFFLILAAIATPNVLEEQQVMTVPS